MLDIPKIKETIKNKCKSLGINQYDFTYLFKEIHEAKARNGVCEEGKVETHHKATLRCWISNGNAGIVNFNFSDLKQIEDAVEIAFHAGSLGSRGTQVYISPETLTPLVQTQDSLEKLAPLTQLNRDIVSLEKDVLSYGKEILGVPYNGIGQEELKRFYFNSLGSFREESHRLGYLLLSATFLDKNSQLKRFAEHYQEERSLDKIYKTEFIEKLMNKVNIENNSAHINSGKKLVVFSPYAFLQILYGFENAFNAQKIIDKHSINNEKSLNSKIASHSLNVSCQPFHPLCLRKKFFDGEGTPTQPTIIIKQGVLENFLHSSQSARFFGVPSNGHGVLGSKVVVAPYFLCVEAGHKPTLQNERGVPQKNHVPTEDFVYIEELKALHAGIKAQQGSFSIPFSGWFLKNNSIYGVKNATIAGDFLILLENIQGLGDLVHHTPIGVSPEVWALGLSVNAEQTQ